MKNYIISISFLLNLMVIFTSKSIPWDALCQLKDIIGKQKNEWLKFAKDDEAAKFDVLIKQQNDWATFGFNNCNDLKNLNLNTKDDLTKKAVSKIFNLYSIQHRNQWSEYAKNSQQKMNDLKIKHEQQLKDFANKYLGHERQAMIAK